MVNRLILLATLLAAAGLIAVMNFFAPMDLGPAGVLLFFTMVYVLAFGICTFLVRIFVGMTNHRKLKSVDYVYAAILGLGPLMFLMVQSFGSFSFWTMGLIIVFEILACFMLKKVTSR